MIRKKEGEKKTEIHSMNEIFRFFLNIYFPSTYSNFSPKKIGGGRELFRDLF